jgi:hemerythrin-like domain-containing protein
MTMADKSIGNGSGARRRFLQILASTTMLITAGSVFGSSAVATVPATQPAGETEQFSPTEALMRDHGLVKRLLLIYGECILRMNAGTELPPGVIADTAKIIRSFIEDYHDKLEEDSLFPKFRKAGKLVDLVDVLTEQHKEGRKLTDITLGLADGATLRNPPGRQKLIESMSLFIRMYDPHEAREDTVLFPAFRTIVTPNEFNALGIYFEFKEQEHFANEGFEGLIDRVAAIEKALGIYDLAQFTPHK